MLRSRATICILAIIVAVFPAPSHAQTGTEERTIRVGDRERRYLVDLPPRYDGQTPLPVVLVFHGGGGSAAGTRTQTGMSAKGSAAGFIAVYPEGSGALRQKLLTWNTTSCCGYAMSHGIDELAFVRALLDDLEARYAVDRARIYATGISNGGMMSYLVGCALADRIAAIAPVSGELTTNDCRPARPLPVLIIHGTADRNLPYDGGAGEKAIGKRDTHSVQYALDFWRTADRCAPKPRTTHTAGYEHAVYALCAGQSAVELYTITGGGHSWPGGQRMARFLDPPSTALDATDVIWQFFVTHPLISQ